MLYRIVKMKFRPEAIPAFVQIFDKAQNYIIECDGCMEVQALQDYADETIFFTYSLWRDEESLNQYRNSERFAEIWAETKSLFSQKAEAWSLNLIDRRRKNDI